jgi:hypothetical protein
MIGGCSAWQMKQLAGCSKLFQLPLMLVASVCALCQLLPGSISIPPVCAFMQSRQLRVRKCLAHQCTLVALATRTLTLERETLFLGVLRASVIWHSFYRHIISVSPLFCVPRTRSSKFSRWMLDEEL